MRATAAEGTRQLP
nr:hypothetical protein [Tanacetum cinerariifolium]